MHGRVKQRYKFDLIKKAGKAMALASKVSIRQDQQGVLSLQFMIELGGNSTESRDREGSKGVVTTPSNERVSFVDFRLVPLLDDESGDEYENDATSDEDSHI